MVCGAKVAEFSGISEGSQSYMYDFGAKYYSLVDPENTGVLTFKKYKMVYAALAATNAKVKKSLIIDLKVKRLRGPRTK